MSNQAQKVLLICPKFFNYQQEISGGLESMGCKVKLVDERPSNSFIFKMLLRLNFRRLLKPILNSYFKKHVFDDNTEYSRVLIINPESINKELLQKIAQKYTEASVVVYLWDSIANKPNSQSLLELNIEVITFDKKDAQSFDIKFLPLFFSALKINNFKQSGSDQYLCDLFFVGTVHSQRVELIAKLDQVLKNHNLNFSKFLYFQSPIIYYVKSFLQKPLRGALKKDVILTPMPYEEVKQRMAHAKAVLDISHPKQSGLSIRIIESIGAGNKIITTNHSMRDYDFYTPELHYVIEDMKSLNETKILEFLKNDLKTQSVDTSKYSLKSWLNQLGF